MRTTVQRPDLLTAATTWAYTQSGSRAQTETGRLRAVERWIDQSVPAHAGETRTEWLLRTYLDAQHEEALADMREEFARRARWEATQKAAARVPVYVRYLLYAHDAPESTRRVWKRLAGRLLTCDDRTRRIAEVAFSRAPWGRMRKRYVGNNCLSPGIQTETNGQSGRRCVSWHYADYTAIVSPDGRRIWVRYPDQSEAEYRCTPCGTGEIEGVIVRRPATQSETVIRAHHLRRYYMSPIRTAAGITWIWDREAKAGYYRSADGERYHTEPRPTGAARRYFLAAVRAFRVRRAEQTRTARRLAAKQRLAQHADRIYVAIEDSIAAGNCPVGTRQFVEQLLGELTDGYPAAVRADVILARRNDAFTRRACVQAALAH